MLKITLSQFYKSGAIQLLCSPFCWRNDGKNELKPEAAQSLMELIEKVCLLSTSDHKRYSSLSPRSMTSSFLMSPYPLWMV